MSLCAALVALIAGYAWYFLSWSGPAARERHETTPRPLWRRAWGLLWFVVWLFTLRDIVRDPAEALIWGSTMAVGGYCLGAAALQVHHAAPTAARASDVVVARRRHAPLATFWTLPPIAVAATGAAVWSVADMILTSRPC